jgi:hypothetical protein
MREIKYKHLIMKLLYQNKKEKYTTEALRTRKTAEKKFRKTEIMAGIILRATLYSLCLCFGIKIIYHGGTENTKNHREKI